MGSQSIAAIAACGSALGALWGPLWKSTLSNSEAAVVVPYFRAESVCGSIFRPDRVFLQGLAWCD
jgi:hypothetical protein